MARDGQQRWIWEINLGQANRAGASSTEEQQLTDRTGMSPTPALWNVARKRVLVIVFFGVFKFLLCVDIVKFGPEQRKKVVARLLAWTSTQCLKRRIDQETLTLWGEQGACMESVQKNVCLCVIRALLARSGSHVDDQAFKALTSLNQCTKHSRHSPRLPPSHFNTTRCAACHLTCVLHLSCIPNILKHIHTNTHTSIHTYVFPPAFRV